MEITKLLTNEKALELAEKLLQNDKNIRDELRDNKADVTYVDEKITILENEIDTNKSALDISISTLDTKIDNTIIEINGMQTQLEQLSGDIASAANAEEALLFMSECGIITPAYQDGTFYTDVNGAIYIL